MQIKRVAQYLIFFSLLLLTACQTSQAQVPTLKDIWEGILEIGTLGFIGSADNLVGFMRIMVFILVFAVLYEASRLTRFPTNIRAVISIVISIISSVVMPAGVLAGIAAAYGTVVASVLIGVPVLGGFYALYRIPSDDRWQIALKIGIILITLVVLIEIKYGAIKGFGL